jgi:hypothetical protein
MPVETREHASVDTGATERANAEHERLSRKEIA